MLYRSSCNSCGGKLRFNPKNQKMVCDYCHNTQEIKVEKQNNSKKRENELDLYICPTCGAKLVSETNEITTFCVYCKNDAIIKEKLLGEFQPEGIIPFKKTKEDAIETFKSLQKKYPLIADKFLDEKNIEEIRGIYIPFWLLDIKVIGSMKAKTKVTKMHDEPGQDIYVEKIKEYENERHGDISYKLVPVDGSTHFEDDIMQNIEPFDYNELKSYSSDYLAGFLAEVYDLSGDIILENANKRVEKSTYEIFRKSLTGGSPAEIEVLDFTYNSEKINEQYVLLPVYLLNIKYNNKLYTFAMNGQTGKIMGNIPSSKAKEIMYFCTLFLTPLIIALLIGISIEGNIPFNIITWLLLILASFIVANVFLRTEKNKLKLVEKDPKINKYIDDRIIETRNNKLVKEDLVTHDVSRANEITVAATLGLGIIGSINRKR